ncbi:hypothetical protein [Streptomyces inhibens]|uniref:hypothetical protein n=1 Tax=Streptomyces inhibens TaxID=2293571 RepID=UPI000FFB1D2E
MAFCLLVSKRKYLAVLTGSSLGLMLLLGLWTHIWLGALAMASLPAMAGLRSFAITRPTGWLLGVIWKLEAGCRTEHRDPPCGRRGAAEVRPGSARRSWAGIWR